MAAVRTIQSLHTRETEYYFQHGAYATPAQLGIQIPLTKNGYHFTLSASPQTYQIIARPTAWTQSNCRRSFYSDQSLAIHQTWDGEMPTAQSETLK